MNWIARGSLVLVLLVLQQRVWAQLAKVESRESQVWLGYANQTWLKPRTGIWLDVGVRWSKFIGEWNTYLVRPGVMYRLTDKMTATVGYALFSQRVPNPEHLVMRPEHRGWQQLNWTQNVRKVQLLQRIRTEQRFIHRTNKGELADGYRFNHRLRYQLSVGISLLDSTRKSLVLTAGDEILINAGKQITYNYFDQNRLFIGLGYQLNKAFNAQLGYMYAFQQLAAGNQYIHYHIVRVSLLHNMKLASTQD